MLIASLVLLLPQVPAEVQGDVSAYGRWLAEARGRYGAILDNWQTWGLLEIRKSFLVRLLLVALGLHLVVRLADEGPRAWQALHVAPPAEGRRPWREWSIPVARYEELGPYLRDHLLARRFRWREQEGSGQFLAAPFPWLRLAWLSLHLGALLLLAGLVINQRWGWRETGLLLGEGETLSLDRADLTLFGQSVIATATSDDRPLDWQSLLVLRRDGAELKRSWVRPAGPLFFHGLLLAQSGLNPALSVVAQDREGRSLEVEVPEGQRLTGERLWLDFLRHGDEAYFAVPSRNLGFRLTYYASLPQRGISHPVVHVQAYQGGQATPLRDGFLQQGVLEWSIDDVNYRLERGYKAVLQAAFMPGAPPIFLGVLLIVAGGLLALLTSGGELLLSGERGVREVTLQLYITSAVTAPKAQRWVAQVSADIERLLNERAANKLPGGSDVGD